MVRVSFFFMPTSCSSKPGNVLAGTDGQVRVVGSAARERLALDRALEGEAETVAGLDDAVLALFLVAALLREHALHFGVHVLLVDLDDRRSTFTPLKSISETGGSTS